MLPESCPERWIDQRSYDTLKVPPIKKLTPKEMELIEQSKFLKFVTSIKQKEAESWK